MSPKWSRLLKFGALCFLCLWFLAGAVFIASPLQKREDFFFANKEGTAICDFLNFYKCAAMTLSSDRLRVYDMTAQLEWTNKLIYPQHVDVPFFIPAMPHFCPLVAPLAWLSLERAYFVWYMLLLASASAGMLVLARERRTLPRLDAATIAFAVLASAPGMVALKLGQTSFFVLALLSIFYSGIVGRADWRSGISLAFITLKPQYAVLPAIAALARKRWLLVLIASTALSIMLVAAGLTIGWTNVTSYPSILSRYETTGTHTGAPTAAMVSLRSFLGTWLPAEAAFALNFLILGASAAVAYWLWTRKTETPADDSAWAMSLTVVLSLIASPHTYAHDCVLLGIPAMLTLPGVGILGAARLPGTALRIWCLTLIFYPVVSWLIYISAPLLNPSALLVPNLLLLASGLWHRIRCAAPGTDQACSSGRSS